MTPSSLSRRQFVSNIASGSAALWLSPHLALQAHDHAPHPVPDKVESLAHPFPLDQVRLLDGPFLDALRSNQDYLHFLPEDGLLHTFRLNAGLPSTAAPLGGWEAPDCELRGHFTGHFLSACALMYASTGDEKIKAKGESIVAELAKCQQAHGNGYLSAFPEEFFDRLREGRAVWAPFYTLHKIMAGHLDMYSLCGSQQALENVQGMGEWIGHWVNGISDDQMQRILRTEYGGTSEALWNLFGVTGERRFAYTATRFEQPDFFDPLAIHQDELKGLHVNTNIPKVIGAARRYELTANPRYRDISSYFLREVVAERTYATGGTSNAEFWRTNPGDLSTELSVVSEECCCGYNMLKLSRHVFAWTADPRYFDYYERTLYNSRLGTEHPATGQKMYYLPLQTGYWKYFHSKLNSFWCCAGTGVEEFSKFGDSIYFHSDRDLYVNLFIPSEVHWPEKGLTLRQQTRFPDEPSTTISIKAAQPVDATFNIRIPSWARQRGTVEINGAAISAWSSPGSYLELNRTWADGDRLVVKFPMALHTEPLLGDASQQAALYGPIVLAGRLGTERLTKEMQFDSDSGETQLSPHGDPLGSSDIMANQSAPGDPPEWLEAVPGSPLTFRTVGQSQTTTLVPLNRLFDERYAVYWKIHSPAKV